MSNVNRLFACVGLSAVLLVAGCAADPTDSSGPPSEAASPAAPAASPSASPDDSVASISTEGYGYIVIGQPMPTQHSGDELISWNPSGCGEGFGSWEASPGAGLFVDTAEFGNAAAAITSIVVLSESGPRTSNDVGVGSTEEQFLAAYPVIDETFDLGGSGTQYNVAGNAGRLQVVVADGAVARFGVVATGLASAQTTLGATDWYGPCS